MCDNELSLNRGPFPYNYFISLPRYTGQRLLIINNYTEDFVTQGIIKSRFHRT